MKVVYVAGPYRAATPWDIEQNVRRAEEAALRLWQTGKVAALCPHTMTRYYQFSAPDEVWCDGTMELLKRCDAILLLPGWQNSAGCCAELATARRLGLPSFENLEAVTHWCANWLKR